MKVASKICACVASAALAVSLVPAAPLAGAQAAHADEPKTSEQAVEAQVVNTTDDDGEHKLYVEYSDDANQGKYTTGEVTLANWSDASGVRYWFFTDPDPAHTGEAQCSLIDFSTELTDVALDVPAKVTISGTEYRVTKLGFAAGSRDRSSTAAYEACDARNQLDWWYDDEHKARFMFDSKDKYEKYQENVEKDANTKYKPEGAGHTNSNIFSDETRVEGGLGAIGSKVVSVTFPSTLREIGSQAFTFCSGITSLNFQGDALERINYYAFNGCSSLKSVNLPASLKELGTQSWCRYSDSRSNSYDDENRGKYTTVNGGNEYVNAANRVPYNDPAGQVFNNCTALESIVLPAGLEVLGQLTFSGCAKLTSLGIPAKITSLVGTRNEGTKYSLIGTDLKALEEINIAEGNEALVSVDGIVYSKDRTTIVFLPLGKKTVENTPVEYTKVSASDFQKNTNIKSIQFGSGLEELDAQAFAQCTSLESIVIPDKVKAIPLGCFNACTSLRSVTLGSGVTTIGALAFTGCTALETLTINASQAIEFEQNERNGTVRGVFFPNKGYIDKLSLYFMGDAASIVDTNGGTFKTTFLAKHLDVYGRSDAVKNFFTTDGASAPNTENFAAKAGDEDVTVTYHELSSVPLSEVAEASVADAGVYDGSAKSPDVSVAPKAGSGVETLVAGTDYEVVVPEAVDAGSYSATVRGLGAYYGDSFDVDFQVSRRPVTVTGLAAKSKAGDGTTAAAIDVSGAKLEAAAEGGEQAADGGGQAAPVDAGAAARGVLAADAGRVGVASAAGAFADAAPGTGKRVAVTAVALSGERAGNYEADLDATNAACALSADIAASDSDGVSGGTAGKSYMQGAGTASAASYRVESAQAKTVAYAGAKTGAKKSAAKPSKKTYKKGMFSGSKVKAVKVPKKVKKAFKKLLTKKYTGTKAKKLKVS